jgi:hypothetical protein
MQTQGLGRDAAALKTAALLQTARPSAASFHVMPGGSAVYRSIK